MSTDVTLSFKLNYHESEQKRSYSISGLSLATLDVDSIRTGAQNINDSLTAGTDGGMSAFYVDDDGNYLTKLTELQLVSVTETPISVPE